MTIDLRGDMSQCGPDCEIFVTKWESWWAMKTAEPVALLDCSPGYHHRLSGKSRNMCSKANRLYTYRPFVYNDELVQIKAVNFSKKIRQGRPMSGWYIHDPEPLRGTTQLCARHRDEWHGGFTDDVLMGYAHVEVLNEIAILNSLLGRALAPAVINGLIEYLAENLGVKHLNYLNWASANDSLTAFKARLGFEEVRV